MHCASALLSIALRYGAGRTADHHKKIASATDPISLAAHIEGMIASNVISLAAKRSGPRRGDTLAQRGRSDVPGTTDQTAATAPTNDMTARLVAVSERRDREAFAALFRYYGPRLKSYLRRFGDSEGRVEEVLQAMAELTEEQREVLRLSFFEDESHEAIARRLGLPIGTVKSRIRLAYGHMRSRLAPTSGGLL
jgi:predicted DNA-binding protein (UPF0251 family)